jgi:hypothetical protein
MSHIGLYSSHGSVKLSMLAEIPMRTAKWRGLDLWTCVHRVFHENTFDPQGRSAGSPVP